MIPVGPTPWGGRVFYAEVTASTMDDAQVLEDRGEADGSAAWAGFQTAGRGRHPGRVWAGSAQDSLLFTGFWAPGRFRVPGFAPSLTVGLGLCFWLEDLGLSPSFPVSMKWPNDLYLGDRKAAGILVRRRWGPSGPRSVHAGIGINLRPPADPSGFRTAAGSLAEAGLSLTPRQALDTLLPALARAFEDPDPRAACEARLWHRGESFELSTPDGPGQPRRGTLLGLDPAGQLVWDRGRGPETVSSGE